MSRLALLFTLAMLLTGCSQIGDIAATRLSSVTLGYQYGQDRVDMSFSLHPKYYGNNYPTTPHYPSSPNQTSPSNGHYTPRY